MTNRELAVQLITARLQAKAILASNPNFCGEIHIPSNNEFVIAISDLEKKLGALDADSLPSA